MVRIVVIAALLLAQLALAQDAPGEAEAAPAPDAPQAAAERPAEPPAEEPGGVKTLAGMSILGNEEAPKSLVIVPWKSSLIGDGLGVTDAMDDRPRPIDKEVFLREVHYYQLRAGAPE